MAVFLLIKNICVLHYVSTVTYRDYYVRLLERSVHLYTNTMIQKKVTFVFTLYTNLLDIDST